MNRWEKDIHEFHGCDYKIIKQNSKIIKYQWYPNQGDVMTAFVLKEIDKEIVIPSESWQNTKELVIYERKMFHGNQFYNGAGNWEDIWKKVGTCRFDYENDDLEYIYEAIWVSMI